MRGVVTSAVVSLIGASVLLWLLPNPQPQPQTRPTLSTSAVPRPGASLPTATTIPEPSSPVSEPTVPDAPADVVVQTAAAFVDGWLTTDPTARGQKLQGCTTPQLLESLVHTQAHKIPRWTIAGAPEIGERNPGGGVAIQKFTNGRSLEILVVPGERPQTWVVAGASEG